MSRSAKRSVVAMVLALGAIGLMASCGRTVAGPGTSCAPGQQIVCACPGGKFSGVQVCSADGNGYGACTIGAPVGVVDAAGVGLDAAKDAMSSDDAPSSEAGSVSPQSCGGGTQCTAPDVCVMLPGEQAGTCGPPCNADTDCPAWLTCSNGQCANCSTCPAGQRCTSMGMPGRQCQSSSDCPGGTFCQTFSGNCWPYTACTLCPSGNCGGGGCSSNNQCPGGQVCVGGVCGACATNDQCGPNAQCTATHTTLQCTCSADGDCSSGEACVSGVCTAACCSNGDCQTGEACIDGVCGACTASSQCGPGATCQGRCSCGTSADCQPGQGCVSMIRECGACQSTADCAPGQGCAAGVCGPCTSFADCNRTGGFTLQPPSGLTCIAGVCSPCTSNSQCGGGQACVGGTCGTCVTDNQCSPVGRCTDGFCTCTSDAQCATNQRCGFGVCVSM